MLIGRMVDRGHKVFKLLLIKLLVRFKVLKNSAVRTVDLVGRLVDGQSWANEEAEERHRPHVVGTDAILHQSLESGHFAGK